MWAYILKRILLMVPTLFGILAITFAVIQFVPGGPVEQMVYQLQGRNSAGEGPAVTPAAMKMKIEARSAAALRNDGFIGILLD